MELNREQIIKALECYSTYNCDKCPIENADCENFGCIKDAIALINSQEQKIFDLENRLKECENGYEGTLALERANVKELTEENERLRAEVSVKKKLLDKSVDLEDEVRADTVRKMQERLKERFSTASRYTKYSGAGVVMVIDQIAKEMLEDAE